MPTSSAPQVKPTWQVEVEDLGLDWQIETDFDLTKLLNSDGVPRRVQIREGHHYAPQAMVDRYAVQMGESSFPPPIVTADHYVIDGNTRIAARIKRGDKISSVVILKGQKYKGSGSTQSETLRALAVTLNCATGLALDKNEARAGVKSMLALGWKYEEIARRLGVSLGTIGMVRREIDAQAKLSQVGLSPKIRAQSLRALGEKPVQALNNAPFKALAELAADAGFNSQEIKTAAKEAKATGSDDEALAYLEDLRSASMDRITQHRRTGNGHVPPAARKLRQTLGYVLKFSGAESELIETSDTTADDHLRAIRASIKILHEVARMQEERNAQA